MAQRSFYRDLAIPGSNIFNDAVPLQVNCCGWANLTKSGGNDLHGRQDYYLQLVTDGSIQSSHGLLSVNSFVIYSPHTPYWYKPIDRETTGYYWIHFTGSHVKDLLNRLNLELNHPYSCDLDAAVRQQLMTQFEQLFQEFLLRDLGFDCSSASLALEILVTLARSCRKKSSLPRRTLESISYLHSSFYKDFPLSKLAEMEHMSQSRYREVFRSQTGYSPAEYRTALRMQKACELLLQTSLSLSEIAASCGYKDLLYFFRAFKKHRGMTPSEYRKNQQAK